MRKKRHLFAELMEGIEEVNAHQAKKMTLKTCVIEKKPRPHVSARLIRNTRAMFNMSRQVFALKLRVSPRTLEKWEQGETVPNEQAAALILMARKYPDTLTRLEKI